VKTEMFGGVSDFSCEYTHGTSTVGGGGKATVRTTVRTDQIVMKFFRVGYLSS